jgi:hypothetical protein
MEKNMQITEISYRELINTGNYENITVEMKASVSKDDDLEMCVAKLSRKVKRALLDINGGN